MVWLPWAVSSCDCFLATIPFRQKNARDSPSNSAISSEHDPLPFLFISIGHKAVGEKQCKKQNNSNQSTENERKKQEETPMLIHSIICNSTHIHAKWQAAGLSNRYCTRHPISSARF